MHSQAIPLAEADEVVFILGLPPLQDVYDPERSLRFQEEMYKSQHCEKQRRIMEAVYASLSSGVWEQLNFGMSFHDMQMVICALQYNPDVIPVVRPHIDRMLNKYDPAGLCRPLWAYVGKLRPPLAA